MSKEYVADIMGILRSIRGAVAVDDYPFIVLPALMLRWIEIEHDENGFDDYEKIYSLGRLSATYGVMDEAYQVTDYLIKAENSLGQVYGGYVSEITAVLRSVPADGFRDILHAIDMAGFSTTESLYDFAVSFIRYYFRTNVKAISRTMSAYGIAQIEKIALGETTDKDTVYDGFAGTGISTLTATSGHGTITLQEINARMACIAEFLCILKGCRANIYVGDCFEQYDEKQRFSKVVTEPNFGFRRPDLQERDLPFYSSDSDIMCIKHALWRLEDTGNAVVLCAAGVLFRSGKTGVEREALVENGRIETVIQIPQGAVYGTSVNTAILVLRKKRKSKDILLVDAAKLLTGIDKGRTEYKLRPENEMLLWDIINNRKEVEGISCIVRPKEVGQYEYSLVVSQYLQKEEVTPEVIDVNALIEENGKLVHELMVVEQELAKVRGKLGI